MNKDLKITITKGRFRKLREWNRRRNYYFKQLKLNGKIYLAKLIWDKRIRGELNVKSIKTILLLRNEGTVGDVVVTTPLIKGLSEAGYTVDLLLTTSSSVVVKYNPYIRGVYQAEDCSTAIFLKSFNHTVAESTINRLRANHYDLIIDLCLFETPVHRLRLFSEINAKAVIGFNKWNCINHYSKSLAFENGKQHVTEAIAMVASFIGIGHINPKAYDLHIPGAVFREVRDFYDAKKERIKIVINVFTGSAERDLSQRQLFNVVKMLNSKSTNITFILLDHRRQLNLQLPDNAIINPFNSLHHVMALLYGADMVITPDTSIVHISAAWEKTLISVYKDVIDNNYLWAPGYGNASQIIVHNRIIADVANIPELIWHEIDQRGLLK